jgi:hypothetical protein
METLRLHPVSPAVLRTTANSFEFAGYRIPAGTLDRHLNLRSGAGLRRFLPEADGAPRGVIPMSIPPPPNGYYRQETGERGPPPGAPGGKGPEPRAAPEGAANGRHRTIRRLPAAPPSGRLGGERAAPARVRWVNALAGVTLGATFVRN